MKTILKFLILFLPVLPALPVMADKLYVYNWTDYTAPQLLEKFENEFGIDVVLDTYDSNETLLAKLKSGGGNYDIIVPSHNFVPIFIAEGLLQEINARDMPTLGNISDKWLNPPWDRGNVYTVPWQLGSTSFTVNTDVYRGAIDTYEILFDPPPALRGQIGMFNSPDDVTAMALIYLGYPLCNESAAQMKQVRDLLVAQKSHVKVYDSDGIKDRLVSGETHIHMNWNGYSFRARQEKPSLQYAIPKEGLLSWVDNLAVPKNAQNPDNAKRFIEFFMRPQNAALQSNFAGYDSGNANATRYLDADKKSAPEIAVPDGASLVFSETCSTQAIALQDRVWTDIKK
ncbi:MAG: extracellular solute-binding protein [Gammaproteobacteria bacterium]|nr:extracellular solute-binding protein [Gammaproteobacteria bacterium]MDD9884055.1 extracellular solute-binding protein [Gammaproteobacteria bacterium]